MSVIIEGIVAGTIFGIAANIPMYDMEYRNKNGEILASFINRFAIGLLTFTVDLSIPTWATGLIIGLLLSLPEAIITKHYKHILFLGLLGGFICGEIAWIR